MADTAAGGKPWTLDAATAAELMSPNPFSIRADASVADAIAAFADRGVSAAPVINEAGRPIGAVTRADILVHDRQLLTKPGGAGQYEARVRDIMTPAIFSVTPETPAHQVVEGMAAMNVHQLFVVDRAGALVGVVTSLDVLRRLRPA